MASIPTAGDLADVIGPFAERVENRSLLLDKFTFHKQWGLGDLKANDAHRWTLLRVSDGGARLLAREAEEKRKAVQLLSVRNPEKAERLKAESEIAASLASTSLDSKELLSLRARHTRRFVGLFRRAFVGRCDVVVGQLEGRLVINLADSLMQNAGISLDRLFGLPFIAGSAVKGVSRHAALEELTAATGPERSRLFNDFRAVFGTADSDFKSGDLQPFRELLDGRSENQRGEVSFLPAYPVNEAKVVVDLTTVHYHDYYRTGRLEDLSKERPLPNPFPAVERGGQFAFCIVLGANNSSAGSLSAARRWLEAGLTVRGIGAKTSSGYGWFTLRPDVLQQIAEEERKAEEAAKAIARSEAQARQTRLAEEARIAALSPDKAALEKFAKLDDEAFARAVSELASLSADEQKGLVLSLLTPQKKESWKRWKKSDKPANKARVQTLQAVAQALGISLP